MLSLPPPPTSYHSFKATTSAISARNNSTTSPTSTPSSPTPPPPMLPTPRSPQAPNWLIVVSLPREQKMRDGPNNYSCHVVPPTAPCSNHVLTFKGDPPSRGNALPDHRGAPSSKGVKKPPSCAGPRDCTPPQGTDAPRCLTAGTAATISETPEHCQYGGAACASAAATSNSPSSPQGQPGIQGGATLRPPSPLPPTHRTPSHSTT